MKVFYSIDDFAAALKKSSYRTNVDSATGVVGPVYPGFAVSWGNYDGVHIGHADLIRQLVRRASALELPSVLLTFSPRPAEFFLGAKAPRALVDIEDKLALLAGYGLDYVLVMPFDADFAALTATEFVHDFLVGKMQAKYLLLGHDTNFGAGRSGGAEFLQGLQDTHGFIVEQMNSVMFEGCAVCSTLIRKLIAAGELGSAQKLLGRTHSVHGRVAHGAGRGGSLLGFPTANLDPGALLLPPHGVYACLAKIGASFYPAAVNLGINPSFTGEKPSLEAHILDFTADLYGDEIRLYFEKYLRAEKRFENMQYLMQQIEADVSETRELITARKAEPGFLAEHPL